MKIDGQANKARQEYIIQCLCLAPETVALLKTYSLATNTQEHIYTSRLKDRDIPVRSLPKGWLSLASN